MKGEKVFFRKKLFGGFNREDVVVYIAKIAEERNEAITAKEKAEKEVIKLTRELQIMRGEMPEPAMTPKPEASEPEAPKAPEAPPPALTTIEQTDDEISEETIETEEIILNQPISFAFEEEAVSVQPIDVGIEEKTEAEDPVKPKELEEIDNDIAKIKEISFIEDNFDYGSIAQEDEKKPARVKIVKKIKSK
jgi:hypothetical protein